MQQHGGMSVSIPPTREEAMAQAEARSQRLDVHTVATLCRRGQVNTQINATQNGFVVFLTSHDFNETLVFARSSDVGLLIHTLYNANLENEKTTKRLRRLMGYL